MPEVEWRHDALDRFGVNLETVASRAPVRSRHVLARNAERIKNTMKDLAPVDTGALLQSIGITRVSDLEFVIGPTMWYAAYPEFGTATQRPQRYAARSLERWQPTLEAELSQLGTELL